MVGAMGYVLHIERVFVIGADCDFLFHVNVFNRDLLGCHECGLVVFFFFSSRRRHTRYWRDWSSDVCSSDLSLPCSPAPPSINLRPSPRTSPGAIIGPARSQY